MLMLGAGHRGGRPWDKRRQILGARVHPNDYIARRVAALLLGKVAGGRVRDSAGIVCPRARGYILMHLGGGCRFDYYVRVTLDN